MVKCKDRESANYNGNIHYLLYSLMGIMGLAAVLLSATVDDQYIERNVVIPGTTPRGR